VIPINGPTEAELSILDKPLPHLYIIMMIRCKFTLLYLRETRLIPLLIRYIIHEEHIISDSEARRRHFCSKWLNHRNVALLEKVLECRLIGAL
jgi:hypothetical protein